MADEGIALVRRLNAYLNERHGSALASTGAGTLQGIGGRRLEEMRDGIMHELGISNMDELAERGAWWDGEGRRFQALGQANYAGRGPGGQANAAGSGSVDVSDRGIGTGRGCGRESGSASGRGRGRGRGSRSGTYSALHAYLTRLNIAVGEVFSTSDNWTPEELRIAALRQAHCTPKTAEQKGVSWDNERRCFVELETKHAASPDQTRRAGLDKILSHGLGASKASSTRHTGGAPGMTFISREALPDMEKRKKQWSAMREFLLDYGYEPVVMGRLGACQFETIAHQVFGDASRGGDVRGAVCEYLLRADVKERMLESWVEEDGAYEHYVARMREPLTWGDDRTLQAAADLFAGKGIVVLRLCAGGKSAIPKRRVVMEPTEGAPSLEDSEQSDPHRHRQIVLYEYGLHFDSVRELSVAGVHGKGSSGNLEAEMDAEVGGAATDDDDTDDDDDDDDDDNDKEEREVAKGRKKLCSAMEVNLGAWEDAEEDVAPDPDLSTSDRRSDSLWRVASAVLLALTAPSTCERSFACGAAPGSSGDDFDRLSRLLHKDNATADAVKAMCEEFCASKIVPDEYARKYGLDRDSLLKAVAERTGTPGALNVLRGAVFELLAALWMVCTGEWEGAPVQAVLMSGAPDFVRDVLLPVGTGVDIPDEVTAAMMRDRSGVDLAVLTKAHVVYVQVKYHSDLRTVDSSKSGAALLSETTNDCKNHLDRDPMSGRKRWQSLWFSNVVTAPKQFAGDKKWGRQRMAGDLQTHMGPFLSDISAKDAMLSEIHRVACARLRSADHAAARRTPMEPRPIQQEAVAAAVQRGQLIAPPGVGKTLTSLLVYLRGLEEGWCGEGWRGRSAVVFTPRIMLTSQFMRTWVREAQLRGYSVKAAVVASRVESSGHGSGLVHCTSAEMVETFLKEAQRWQEDGGLSFVFCTYQSASRIVDTCRKIKWGGFGMRVFDEAHRVCGVRGQSSKGFFEVLEVESVAHLSMTATPKVAKEKREAYMAQVQAGVERSQMMGKTQYVPDGAQSMLMGEDEVREEYDDTGVDGEDVETTIDLRLVRAEACGTVGQRIVAAALSYQTVRCDTERDGALAKTLDSVIGAAGSLEEGVANASEELEKAYGERMLVVAVDDAWTLSTARVPLDAPVVVVGIAEGVTDGKDDMVVMVREREPETVCEPKQIVTMGDVEHHGKVSFFCSWERAVQEAALCRFDVLFVEEVPVELSSTHDAVQQAFQVVGRDETKQTERDGARMVARSGGEDGDVRDAVTKVLGVVTAREVLGAMAVVRALVEGRCKHVVTFHSSVVGTLRFVRLLGVVADVMLKGDWRPSTFFGSASSYQEPRRRDAAISLFRTTERSVLCTCRLLLEGYDFPGIDGVCYVDPLGSVVDIAQSLGRGVRVDGRNPDKVLQVLLPLGMEIIMGRGSRTNESDSDGCEKDESGTCNEYVMMDDGDGGCSGGTDTDSETSHNVMAEGEERHEGDKETWTKDTYGGILSVLERLEKAMGHESESALWTQLLMQLVVGGEGAELGGVSQPTGALRDVSVLRLSRTTKQLLCLTPGQLQELGERLRIVSARLTDARHRQFLQTLQKLKDFVKRHGELPRRKGKRQDEDKLAKWMGSQRQAKKKGKLSAERVVLLDKVPGWWWEAEDTFLARLEEFKAYVRDYGELPKRARGSRAREGEESLADWARKQCRKKSDGKLSPERVALLDDVPGWVWEMEDKFLVRLGELSEFMAKHGKLPVKNWE